MRLSVLSEEGMTIPQALQIFGLSAVPTSAELETKWARASRPPSVEHPDRKIPPEVRHAYEVLKIEAQKRSPPLPPNPQLDRYVDKTVGKWVGPKAQVVDKPNVKCRMCGNPYNQGSNTKLVPGSTGKLVPRTTCPRCRAVH